MTDKNRTVYVTARQAELNALHIQISMRLTLGDLAQVQHDLSGMNGIAHPMRDMIGKLVNALRAVHTTVAFPEPLDKEGPSCIAAFDTDDLNNLQVLMKFTFVLEQWRALFEQLTGVRRSASLNQLFQALTVAVGKLKQDFTAQLVVPTK